MRERIAHQRKKSGYAFRKNFGHTFDRLAHEKFDTLPSHASLRACSRRSELAPATHFGLYSPAMSELTHMDEEGRVSMVDTSAKMATARRAVASARVLMSPETVEAVRAHRTPKGDPLETARIAGIMAAKRTSELIPLCHPLPLTHVEVRAEARDFGVYIEAESATNAQTGVEMEALVAASVAALTIYDMCKAVEKGINITDVRLESKTGGKSGTWKREGQDQS